MNVLIFGGTGHLGREVTRQAVSAGHSVRVASRTRRPDEDRVRWYEADLATGKGLKECVSGVEAIVFAAGDPKNHVTVEVDGLKRLVEVAKEAGVGHLLFVSIVGVDKLPVPYYRTKLAAQRVLAEGGVPYSVLRATQFHYFVAMMFGGLNRVPFVLPVPRGFRVQPVGTEDVAVRIMKALADGPGGLLKDFCGPEVFALDEAARMWRDARGSRKPIVRVPVLGKTGAAFRQGHNTNADGDRGASRWADWLVCEYR